MKKLTMKDFPKSALDEIRYFNDIYRCMGKKRQETIDQLIKDALKKYDNEPNNPRVWNTISITLTKKDMDRSKVIHKRALKKLTKNKINKNE